jgi:hypothetical protein
MLKSACIKTVIAKTYTTQVYNPWYLHKIFGSTKWPNAQNEFQIQITQRIRNRIRNKCSKVNTGPNCVD